MDLPGGPVVKTMCLQSSRCREVRSLVRELRSHMPHSTAKRILKYTVKKKIKSVYLERKKETQRYREQISVYQGREGLEEVNNQFSSVTQLCRTLFDPMDCSMPGLPVHHQLPEST